MKNNVKTLSLCLGLASLALGQTTTAPIYQMSILAGIPTPNALGDNGPSTFGIVSAPQGIAVDKSGNVFVADNTNSRIRRIDATTGIITTFTNSNISNPNGMAFDSKGNLWVAENGNNGQVIRIQQDSKGAVTSTVIAGTNVTGTYGGDGQYAFNTFLNSPAGVAIDGNDNVYVADTSNNRIRMIKNVNGCIYNSITTGNNPVTTTCTMVTIAGGGPSPQLGASCGTNNTCTPSGNNTVGDNGPALTARVQGPYGIAVTPDGSTVYFSQNGDHRIRSINMLTGVITTLIGNCLQGALVITCPSGSFGSATSGNSFGDGKAAVQGTTNSPRGVFLDSANNILYWAEDKGNRIRYINLATGIVNTAVGGGSNTGDAASGLNSGLLTSLSLNGPWGVWISNGLIYWVEQGSNKVRVADPVGGFVKTLVNQPRSSGSGGTATNSYLGFSTSLATSASPRVAVDGAGNVYTVESATNKIRKITSDGTISDWAGTGASGSTGDGGPAAVARLSSPQQVAFDSQGNAYICDTGNNKIRKVDTNGVITTVVGRAALTCTVASSATGCVPDKSDYVGDGGAPLNARLSGPQGIAVDSLNNLIIADTGHNSIRYVNLSSNVISTIGGGVPVGVPNGPTDGRSALGSSGYADSTNALLGLLNLPRGVAVDASGDIYIADYNNSANREMVPTNLGTNSYSMFTFYGSGSNSGTTPAIPTGTGAASVPARIRISSGNATSVAVDPGGNIYYALAAQDRVVVISADHSKVYIVAGGGSADTGLNYTSANAANLQTPAVTGVAVDANGVVYTADRTGLVRKLVCTKNCLPLN
jgi:DNA-binding beta-propeller fold protein YncE